jgi:hypothetical protein
VTSRPRVPSLAFALAASALVAAAGAARGQATPSGVVLGRVVDSAGRALADAEVRLSRADDATLGTARTRADGGFALDAPATGETYRLVARRVGFRPDTARLVVRAGDTTRVTIVLRPAPVALPTVTVRERRAARFSRPFIDSTEIANADVPRAYRRHAWDVVRFLRPVMLGDWNWKCAATEHVFVNGRRVTGRSIITPAEVLERIPADDIAEMRYVSCWDTSMPGVAGANTVYVVLKPGRAYRDE